MVPSDQIADYETFAFPAGYRRFLIFGAIFVGTLCLGSVGQLFISPALWPFAIFGLSVFGFVLKQTIDALHRSRDEIRTRRTGLEYLPHYGSPRLLLWEEIARIKECPYLQRLVVFDRSGTRNVKLEYRLENFDLLRSILLQRATNRAKPQIPATFHRTRHFLIFFVAGSLVCVAMACLSYTKGGIITVVTFLGFALFALLPLLLEPVIVRVLADRIVLRFVFARRSIGLDEISKVKLQNATGSHDSRVPVVLIETTNRKPVKLAAIREGSIALYETLVGAWRSAQTLRDA